MKTHCHLHRCGVVALGALFGAGVGAVIAALGSWRDSEEVLIMVIGALVFGIATVCFEKYVLMAATSLLGSFGVVACIDRLAAWSSYEKSFLARSLPDLFYGNEPQPLTIELGIFLLVILYSFCIL